MLRKPPRPNTRKDRPVSLPPVFRGAKLEEMPVREGLPTPVRSQSTDVSPDLNHPNKENKPFDRSDGRDGKRLVSTGSVDSGLDSDVSCSVCMSTACSYISPFHDVEICVEVVQPDGSQFLLQPQVLIYRFSQA